MTLQADGTISINDLAGEYGGSAPHALSEYYRNGSLVPDTITTGQDTFAWGLSSDTSWFNGDGGNYVFSPAGVAEYWFYTSNVLRYNVTSFAYPFYISIGGSGSNPPSGLGQDYEEWSPRTQYLSDASGTYYGLRIKVYVSVQTGSQTTTSVNQNVPTSGAISLSNFYGGRKT